MTKNVDRRSVLLKRPDSWNLWRDVVLNFINKNTSFDCWYITDDPYYGPVLN